MQHYRLIQIAILYNIRTLNARFHIAMTAIKRYRTPRWESPYRSPNRAKHSRKTILPMHLPTLRQPNHHLEELRSMDYIRPIIAPNTLFPIIYLTLLRRQYPKSPQLQQLCISKFSVDGSLVSHCKSH